MTSSIDYTQFGRLNSERARFQGTKYQLESLGDMKIFRDEILSILEDEFPSVETRIYDANALAFTQTRCAPRTEPILLNTWNGITRKPFSKELQAEMESMKQGATVARIAPGIGAFLRSNMTDAQRLKLHELRSNEYDTVGVDIVVRGETRLSERVVDLLKGLGIVQKNESSESQSDIYSISTPFNRTPEEQALYRTFMLPVRVN